ncbi:predicted protein [Naegleria gruberi]|uniref:Predicted protein n=1 Tax=Naegleria gruberi TaxID=5762 RepID=D2VVK6_NAEGR|nr:uncharacterized protein NAEGRDRAFT_73052 [Naegleria gruberi]EFC39128.1 predicted protein [Naegleria gruberi]|eukprot:XP_002671872.1 predicted protein [Naegleria gruberi strain NEG-M]
MSSNDKKRLACATKLFSIPNSKKRKTIEEIRKWNQSDVLNALKEELGLCDDDLNQQLRGMHLYNAICAYQTCTESNKTPQEAKQAVINSLMDGKDIHKDIAEAIANWLITDLIKNNEQTDEGIAETENISGEITVDQMMVFITKHINSEKFDVTTMYDKIQRSSGILVHSFGTDFEFVGRDEPVNAIMNVYQKQDSKIKDKEIIDKSDVRLSFIAAAPGVGKSRLLKEMGVLLAKTKELSVDYFPLFVTFGNGCSYDQIVESFRPIESLLLRMIYSIVVCFIDMEFDAFRKSFSAFVKNRTLSMTTVLTAFRQRLFENSDKIGFYIAIDEAHSVNTGTNEKQLNPLRQIMSGIGQFIQHMPRHKTNILPLFAGTYHSVISHNLAGSTYTPEYIPITALLPEGKIRYILDKLQPSNDKLINWRTNTELRHFIRLFGGFPRGIEFYLQHLQETNLTERTAWGGAFATLTNKYPVFNSLYSKTLLYCILTRKVISKTDVIGTHAPPITFSDMENKGYIMLDQVGEDEFIAIYPPVLLRNLIPTEFTKLYEDLFFSFDKNINGGCWEKIIHRYLYLTLSLLSDNEEDLTIEHLFPFTQMQSGTASIKLQRIPKVEMMCAVNHIHRKQQKIKLTTSSGYPTFDFDVRANNNLDFKQKECYVVLNATAAKAGDVLILGLQEKHGTAILVFHIQCKWADSESGNLSLAEVNLELEKNRKLEFTNEKDEPLEVHNITIIITGKTVSNIPNDNDLIVIHKENFADYFGVFANQMEFLHANQFLYINECNCNELQSFKSVGDKEAATIIEKRGESGFVDDDDLQKKTGKTMFNLLSKFDIIY